MRLNGISDNRLQRLAKVQDLLTFEKFQTGVHELQEYERRLSNKIRVAQEIGMPELTEADLRIKDMCYKILDETDRTSMLRHWVGGVAGNLSMGTGNYESVMNDFYNVVEKLSNLATEAGDAYNQATNQPSVEISTDYSDYQKSNF